LINTFRDAVTYMNNREPISYGELYLMLDDEVSRAPVTVKCKGERPVTIYKVGTLFDKHYVIVSQSADKDFNWIINLKEIEEVMQDCVAEVIE
jgi:hypothetical protein